MFYEVEFPLMFAVIQTDFRLKICSTTPKHTKDSSYYETVSFMQKILLSDSLPLLFFAVQAEPT